MGPGRGNADGSAGLFNSGIMAHIPAMDITPHIRESRVIIDGYGDGGFRVNGERRDGALIVLEDHAVSIPATDLNSLTSDMLQPLYDAADELDVVIFGMGERMDFIPPEIQKTLTTLNIGSDPMDTGAACRCFNVLVTEDRRAAAVLLPV